MNRNVDVSWFPALKADLDVLPVAHVVAEGLDEAPALPVLGLQADARVLAVVVGGEEPVGHVHSRARILVQYILSSANVYLRGCVNPAPWLLLLATGTSFSQHLIEIYAFHSTQVSKFMRQNLKFAPQYPVDSGPGRSRAVSAIKWPWFSRTS